MGEQSNTDTNHPTLFSSGVSRPCCNVLVLALAMRHAAAGDTAARPTEAQGMVARAIAYYDEMGAEAAVARFNADTRLRSSWTAISTSSLSDPKEPSSPTASTPRFWDALSLASFVRCRTARSFGVGDPGLMASAEGA